MLCDTIGPHHLNLFDRPRLIIAFRDPVAIAMRTSLSVLRVWVAEHGIELNRSGKRLCDFGSSA